MVDSNPNIKIPKSCDQDTENTSNKIDDIYTKTYESQLGDMQASISTFCKILSSDEKTFDKNDAFKCLIRYLCFYSRILYSEFSNIIYAAYTRDVNEATPKVGNMLTRLNIMLDYTETAEFEQLLSNVIRTISNKKYEVDISSVQKTLIKIGDHVSLAEQQYNMLKESDEDSNNRIERKLTPFRQEMNAQLLTMIGIFTALAFLLFGGISSLENLFAHSTMPIFKFMVVGSIWTFCLLNLLYVFLFCVSKMSGLHFSEFDEQKDVFRDYAIVWWSDFICISIMVLSFWGYYLQKKDCYDWFDAFFIKHSSIFSVLIVLIIIRLGYFLWKKTFGYVSQPELKDSQMEKQ